MPCELLTCFHSSAPHDPLSTAKVDPYAQRLELSSEHSLVVASQKKIKKCVKGLFRTLRAKIMLRYKDKQRRSDHAVNRALALYVANLSSVSDDMVQTQE